MLTSQLGENPNGGGKKIHTAQCPRTEPRRTGPPSHPIPGHVFPQDECRRSERPGQLWAEAHRGDHPPAVRRRGAALTQRQRRRRQGKKKQQQPTSACKTSERRELKPSAGTCSGWISVKIHKTSEATEVQLDKSVQRLQSSRDRWFKLRRHV